MRYMIESTPSGYALSVVRHDGGLSTLRTDGGHDNLEALYAKAEETWHSLRASGERPVHGPERPDAAAHQPADALDAAELLGDRPCDVCGEPLDAQRAEVYDPEAANPASTVQLVHAGTCIPRGYEVA